MSIRVLARSLGNLNPLHYRGNDVSQYFFLAQNRRLLIGCLALVSTSFFAVQGVAQTLSAVSSANESKIQQKQAPGPTADFFVATNGKDSWSGTLAAPNNSQTDGPFASVARAQNAVRNLIQSNPNRPIVVMIRQGAYYLPLSPTNPGTLTFNTNDSGTENMPIAWENYPGEYPSVNAGEAIGAGGLGLRWTNASGNLWQVQLPGNTQTFRIFVLQREEPQPPFSIPLAILGRHRLLHE